MQLEMRLGKRRMTQLRRLMTISSARNQAGRMKEMAMKSLRHLRRVVKAVLLTS
jgi:hypothetical protein